MERVFPEEEDKEGERRRDDLYWNGMYSVFLFSILGMGVGPSELGKLAREKWKLGKVETCL